MSASPDFFKSRVLGHPAGLFVLFFTEMWERFSFYGMRVLLINFLTMAAIGSNPGWEWSSKQAGALFGTYAGLLYLSPIVGGILADRILGYRLAVLIGALIMTVGHASMALETEASLYIGLGLLVMGTGFFKPNMISFISQMYKDLPEKKDGAYTIFYMGVNAGAFFGMLICGYLAENVGWSWGFGLAGIFMLLGSLQFWLAKPLFGTLGDRPKKETEQSNIQNSEPVDSEPRNPFTVVDGILIFIAASIGLTYLLNDPLSSIAKVNLIPEALSIGPLSGPVVLALMGLAALLTVVVSRLIRYSTPVRNRMIAVVIFAFFTVFFWMSFEQGATSLVLFARDFTQRTLTDSAAVAYRIVNALLTTVPLGIITWVLIKLMRETRNSIPKANLIMGFSFVVVWGIVGWMVYNDSQQLAYRISMPLMEQSNKEGEVEWLPRTESQTQFGLSRDTSIMLKSSEELLASQVVYLHKEKGNWVLMDSKTESKVREAYQQRGQESALIPAKVIEPVSNLVEITTSWFSILNSFFIIAFASLFTKWWDSKYNPSVAQKYGLGLIVMGLGFGCLAIGSAVIPQGAAPGFVKVSMVWLVVAYLFHTLGELCVSPVGLSNVSKLVPPRMIAFMFGMWYLAIAIGNKLAATLGGQIEHISANYSLSTFFLIFTLVPVAAGILVASLNPLLKRLMYGKST
jgi:POT family proton-dependent oligopeptide transporter